MKQPTISNIRQMVYSVVGEPVDLGHMRNALREFEKMGAPADARIWTSSDQRIFCEWATVG